MKYIAKNNMAQTPQEFFSKNLKWITIGLLILFLFKFTQSCNRNMSLNIIETKHTVVIDSLENVIDSIQTDYFFLQREYEIASEKFNFELKLEQSKADAANQRAASIQSVAEKIKSNTTTTLNIRGAEVDTTKKEKE